MQGRIDEYTAKKTDMMIAVIKRAIVKGQVQVCTGSHLVRVQGCRPVHTLPSLQLRLHGHDQDGRKE